MAHVPEQTLSWLYSRLHEYHDPQRAYTDIARTLAAYPSLPPRTDAYTYESGVSALLLNLDGTVPVDFRGTTYRFPIKLWVPQSYPQEPPIVYVQPSKDMLIRPGQHVGVDGRVYHPYLRDWVSMWDRAGIIEFLGILQSVFSKEPPVISRAQQQQFQQRPKAPSGNPAAGPPQLPPKPRTTSMGQPTPSPAANSGPQPPPRPPKPGEEYAEPSRDVARDGPPLPPLPAELSSRPASVAQPRYQSAFTPAPPPPAGQSLLSPGQPYPPGRSPGPPPSPLPPGTNGQSYRTQNERSPVSPISPVHGYSELPETKYSHPAPLPPPQFQQQFQQRYQSPPAALNPGYPSGYPPQQSPPPPQGHPQAYPPPGFQTQSVAAPPATKAPAIDLLSDPFDISLPSQPSSAHPAPPIPPNPEKEHLLTALSRTLAAQVQAKAQQNLSALAPLRAQNAALTAANDALSREIQDCERLAAALSSNETILRQSIAACEETIARHNSNSTSHQKPQQIDIDELLVPPTVVAGQLWRLCADEAAAREAMYVLQRAVDRGRISGPDFVRQMRGLGRECFFKMALARKCARGMGLEGVRALPSEY